MKKSKLSKARGDAHSARCAANRIRGKMHSVAADGDVLASKVFRLELVIKLLVESLQDAKAGLQWYQDMHPEHTDGSDDEAMERIDAALDAAKAINQPDKAA